MSGGQPAEDGAAGEVFRGVALAAGALALAVPEVLLPGVPQALAVLVLLGAGVGGGLGTRAGDLVGAGFLLLAVLGVVWSVDTGQSVVTVMGWVAWGGLLTLPRARDGWLVHAVALCLVLFALSAAKQLAGGLRDAGGEAQALAVAQDMRGFVNLWAERGRALGPFASPDMLATAALPMVAIPASAALTAAPGPRRVLHWTAAVLGLGAVVSTQSVGALVSLAAAVVLVGVVAARRSRVARNTFVALAVVALSGVALLVAARAQQPNNADVAAQPAHTAALDRLEDWGNALGMMDDAPLWGVGPGAFESAFNAWSPPGRRYAAYVHNTTLQVVVEMGVLGGLLVLLVYLLLVREAWLAARGGDAGSQVLAVGVLAGVLHHQLDYGGHTVAGAGLFLAAGVLRARLGVPRVLPGLPLRLALGMMALGAAWVCAGISLSERNVPRLPGEESDVENTRRGAALLSFDAHAQLAVAQDAAAWARVLTSRGGDPAPAWALADAAAQRAASLAPLLPAGPMMLARGHLERGNLAAALPALNAAVARSCCSRRLRQERLLTARALGDAATVAVDQAWLNAVGAPVP